MKNIYVQAITQLIVLGREVEVVLARAKEVMEVRGHGRLYVEVLKEVVAVLEQQATATRAKITVVRAKDATSLEVFKALTLLDCANETPAVTIDDTIIGGVVAKKGSTHIDLSYKSALQKLYQAITA